MKKFGMSILGSGFVVASACASHVDATFAPASLARATDVAPRVDREALKAHVAAIVNARTTEVPVKSLFSIQEVLTHVNSADYVAGELTKAGLSPISDMNEEDGIVSRTVYADIPGEQPERVLLTGHHDAWFQSGADDNASALAVLLEAARILKDTRPKRGIRIIAFDREEEGLLGAARYLRMHPGEPIRVVLNMDCVGYASHVKGSQDAPPGLALRDTGDFLAVIANEAGRGDVYRVDHLTNSLNGSVETLGLIAPDDGYTAGSGAFMRSDHAPFWRAGVPALFLTDTADFRNHNYHTKDDLPGTLDYDFLHATAKLIVAYVAAFAEGD
jgi:Zn-dependent M28 family amino/carboxypeptidase